MASGGNSAAPVANEIWPTRPSTGALGGGREAVCCGGGEAGRAGAAAGAGAGAGAAAGGGAGVGAGVGAALAAGAGSGAAGCGGVACGAAGGSDGGSAGAAGGAADSVDDGGDGGGVSCGGAGGVSGVGAGEDGAGDAAATLGGVRVAGGGGGGGVKVGGGGGAPVSAAAGARGGVGGLSVKTGGSAGGENGGADPCATADGAVAADPRVDGWRAAVRVWLPRDWLFDVGLRGGWVSAGAPSDAVAGAVEAMAERADGRWRVDGAVSDVRRAGAGREPRSSSTLQSTSTLLCDCRSCSWARALGGATAVPAQATTARLIAQATPRMRAIPVCACSTRIIRALPLGKTLAHTGVLEQLI